MVELAREVRAKMRVEVAVNGKGNARAAARTSFKSSNQGENKAISLHAKVDRHGVRHRVGTVTEAER